MINKRRRHKIFYTFPLLAIMLLQGCYSPYSSTGTKWNLSAIYNPTSSKIHPVYRVYHKNDNESELNIKVFPTELAYREFNSNGKLIGKFSIEMKIYHLQDESAVLFDSSTYSFSIEKKNKNKIFEASVLFSADTGKFYQIRLLTKDIQTKDFNLQFVNVDKRNKHVSQDFYVTKNKEELLYSNHISSQVLFNIHNRHKLIDTLFISYYKDPYPIPDKYINNAISLNEVQPDSTYMIYYTPNRIFKLQDQGVYYARFDTSNNNGVVLLNYDKYFPKVKTTEALIYPLQYIATEKTFNEILNAKNQKKAVDDFWIKVGGNKNAARELIRIYYNRTYFANYYFTSSIPGWKTDRGSVYILYGPPDNIDKNTKSETWIYYTKGASNSIQFTFNHLPIPTDPERFILDRSNNLNWRWNEMVQNWRNGKIVLY